jgi:hypothetical protein
LVFSQLILLEVFSAGFLSKPGSFLFFSHDSQWRDRGRNFCRAMAYVRIRKKVKRWRTMSGESWPVQES